MLYLKRFKQFESKDTYHQVFDVNMVTLYKVADKIYAVVCPDNNLRNMIFCRFQEHYESSTPLFQGKHFKMPDYVNWYKTEFSKKSNFTYPQDWAGFNLPSESIENCLSGIQDETDWDIMMKSIIQTIRNEESDKFYLLGVANIDMGGEDVLDHEIHHGMYYTDTSYKETMDRMINQMDPKDKEAIAKSIIETGYAESVIMDEIGAYLTTGLIDGMENLGLEKYIDTFKKVFQEFFNKHVKGLKRIKINWI